METYVDNQEAFKKRCNVNGCQEFDALKYCKKIALMINKTKKKLSNHNRCVYMVPFENHMIIIANCIDDY
jgi:hypothetical protein